MSKLLSVTCTNDNRRYVYRIKKNPNNTKKSNLGSFGMDLVMYHDITGNCQLGSIQVAQKLGNLTPAEFKEFWEEVRDTSNTHMPRWYKSSVLVDVRSIFVNKLVYRFKKIGAHVRLKKAYKNRTTSDMTMMIIDLNGKRELSDGSFI
jgi:hypothetical protein